MLVDSDINIHVLVALVALLGDASLGSTSPWAGVGLDCIKNLLLQQVTKVQDGGLIGNQTADQVYAVNVTHGGHLDQRLFNGWINERMPLLSQVDPCHDAGRILGFLQELGVVMLDRLDRR